jgi:hypothetical protein
VACPPPGLSQAQLKNRHRCLPRTDPARGKLRCERRLCTRFPETTADYACIADGGKIWICADFQETGFFLSVIGGHKIEQAMTIQSSAQRLEIKRRDS